MTLGLAPHEAGAWATRTLTLMETQVQDLVSAVAEVSAMLFSLFQLQRSQSPCPRHAPQVCHSRGLAAGGK